MRAPLLALTLALAACAAQPLSGAAGLVGTPEGNAQTHYIPMVQADGTQALLLARVCSPDTPKDTQVPSRVVVIAHGSPSDASKRPLMQLTPCDNEAVRWFTTRGNLVVLALRRGYGGTGGPYLEVSAPCTAEIYARAARESARDVAATVAYAVKLPEAKPDGAVVVGQSAGGWATLGLDSMPHPAVVALVSMAGGRGGHVGNRPDDNCRPDNLAAAAGELGRTATTPMLWIYTANDSFFAPGIASSVHQAFTASGGQADLRQLPAFGNDGHNLFFSRGGSAVWGPLMDAYLRARGAT